MQAVIITAHRDLRQVYELATLLSRKFEIYIHIDKDVAPDEVNRSGLLDSNKFKIYQKFYVNWGRGKSLMEYNILNE